MPYMRGGRRLVRKDGYSLSYRDIQAKRGSRRGTRFDDRVAIGGYPVDIHPIEGCNYIPKGSAKVAPYYIPYRAMHSDVITNLLVAGKALAQDYVVSSSTRVHSTEFATGSSAGAIAALLYQENWSTMDGAGEIEALQEAVKPYSPIEWNIK